MARLSVQDGVDCLTSGLTVSDCLLPRFSPMGEASEATKHGCPRLPPLSGKIPRTKVSGNLFPHVDLPPI